MSMYYQSLVESYLEPVAESHNDVIYRCPFCESSRGSGHLYINYDKNMYHCYKCDIGGRDIRTLLTKMGYSFKEDIPPSVLIRDSSNIISRLDSITKSLKSPVSKVELKEFSRDLSICTEYFLAHTRELTYESRQYLLSRGLTDEEIQVYGIREGIDLRGKILTIGSNSYTGRDYSNRVLVPSLVRSDEDVKVSYYVARDMTGTKSNKYLNPPSDIAYSSEDIWNLSLAKRMSRTVIICEGVFTAIAAGRGTYNSVATYGKSLAEISNSNSAAKSQADKLVEANFDEYIVAYDADAYLKIDDTCKYLSERGMIVKFVLVPPIRGPHTDLSDLSDEDRSKLLSEAIPYTQESRLRLILGTSL